MAADVSITVNGQNNFGIDVANLHDMLQRCFDLSESLYTALAQANADGGTVLMDDLGTTSSDNASAVLGMVNGVRADLESLSGGMTGQFLSRVHRA